MGPERFSCHDQLLAEAVLGVADWRKREGSLVVDDPGADGLGFLRRLRGCVVTNRRGRRGGERWTTA